VLLIGDNLNKIHEHGPPATKTFSDGRLAIKTELPVARRDATRRELGNEKLAGKMRRISRRGATMCKLLSRNSSLNESAGGN